MLQKTNVKIEVPIIDKVSLKKTKLKAKNENIIFENDSIIIKDIDYLFSSVIFNNYNLIDSELINSYFIDVIFNNCDLSNINFTKTAFKRVEFNGCKLIGTILNDSMLENVVFNNCNLKYVNISDIKLKEVHFKESNLDEASFFSVKINKVIFDKCSFVRTEFESTSLLGVDLSTSDISFIKININNLKGLIVNNYQAVELSNLLGIIIKED